MTAPDRVWSDGTPAGHAVNRAAEAAMLARRAEVAKTLNPEATAGELGPLMGEHGGLYWDWKLDQWFHKTGADRDDPAPLPPCTRCGHSPDDHRLDDSLNLSPDDPDTPFRCLGPDLTGCAHTCPDYKRPHRAAGDPS